MTEIKPTPDGLFAAIQHGDDDHRAWLKEAVAAYFEGRPVPGPRGLGRKEVRIESLLNGLREARGALQAIFDRQVGPLAPGEARAVDGKTRRIASDALAHLDTLLAQEGEG